MSAILRGRTGSILVARRYLATHAPLQEKDCTSITPPYHALQERLAVVRKFLGNRPFTLAEKILYSHLADPERTISGGGLKRGETYLLLHPQVRRCFSFTSLLGSDLGQLEESCYARCKCTVCPNTCYGAQLTDWPLPLGWHCEAPLVGKVIFADRNKQVAVYERWAFSVCCSRQHTL